MAKQTHIFTCSCDNIDRNHKEFKQHLKDVHQLEAEDLKGNRQMVSHIDFTRSYSSTYKWKLDTGLEFTEFFEATRSKKDMMWH